MRRTSVPWVVGAAILAFAVTWAALGAGRVYVAVPWATAIVLLAPAVALWVGGRAVKRMVEGERTTMTPIAAARIAALAQACAWGGAVMAGYLAAQIGVALTNMHAAFASGHLWSSIAGAAASALLVVVALVVEHWCSLPPDDDATAPHSPSEPEPA